MECTEFYTRIPGHLFPQSSKNLLLSRLKGLRPVITGTPPGDYEVLKTIPQPPQDYNKINMDDYLLVFGTFPHADVSLKDVYLLDGILDYIGFDRSEVAAFKIGVTFGDKEGSTGEFAPHIDSPKGCIKICIPLAGDWSVPVLWYDNDFNEIASFQYQEGDCAIPNINRLHGVKNMTGPRISGRIQLNILYDDFVVRFKKHRAQFEEVSYAS